MVAAGPEAGCGAKLPGMICVTAVPPGRWARGLGAGHARAGRRRPAADRDSAVLPCGEGIAGHGPPASARGRARRGAGGL